LMSKDMEMSCDENVVKKMGNDIKGSYANSLLSLSIKRSGLLMGSPLAFGESNIKSRIKNIITYKKPTIWLIIITVFVTAALLVAFTANPKNEQAPTSDTYSGYNIKALIANKTLYVGDNSKVIALIDAMSLPKGIVRDTFELQTDKAPYGITINLIMNDASNVTVQEAKSGDSFYRNAILLFSLIDNVDTIKYKISDSTGNYDGESYIYTYTRKMIEEMMGEDVRPYAVSTNTIKKLLDRLSSMSFITAPTVTSDQIERYLEIIISSPKTSSNPNDYIKAHQNEYDSILKMGDEALNYLLAQFEKSSNNNDLRGHIMRALCTDLLGDRNNVTDESLSQ